jgi:hypothetical protein
VKNEKWLKSEDWLMKKEASTLNNKHKNALKAQLNYLKSAG